MLEEIHVRPLETPIDKTRAGPKARRPKSGVRNSVEDACFLYPTRKVKHGDGQRFAIAAASIGFLAVSDRIDLCRGRRPAGESATCAKMYIAEC